MAVEGEVRGVVSGNLALVWAWSQAGRGRRAREWGVEATMPAAGLPGARPYGPGVSVGSNSSV